jgi:RNA polymerase sigma-70 factor (ECF subfamily)
MSPSVAWPSAVEPLPYGRAPIPFANLGERDHVLVKACQSGENAAWEELVRRHTRRIHGLCYRFTGRDCEARDMTQEVFLRVFCTLGSFRANELSFVAWLTVLTRNLLVDNYRHNRNECKTVPIEEQRPRIERFSSAMDHPDRALAGREAGELLQAALLKLPPELREIVILYDLHEMRYRDIALVVGIPEGTVKSRLNRARGILARLLRKHKLAA